MKLLSATLAIAAISFFAGRSASAQSWQVYPQGAFSPSAVTLDPAGVTAYAINDVRVRRGDAGGTLWSDAFLPNVPAGYQWLANRNIAASPDASVYLAAGLRNLADGSRLFSLYKSRDGAITWQSVFTVSYSSPRPPSEGSIGALTTDAAGSVYLANSYFPGTPGSWAGTLNYYKVRKGTTDPLTGELVWSIVDHYPDSGQLAYSPSSMTIRPQVNPSQSCEIWTSGFGIDAKTFKNAFPFVRRSLDGGANWMTITALPVPRGYSYNSGQIVAGADVNGWAYISVAYQTSSGRTTQNNWLTFRSLDHGSTWTLVDIITAPSGPASFAADSFGGVFIVGNGVVRTSINGGNTWFSPILSGANTVATDLVGDVLIGGNQAIYRLPAP